MAQSTILALGTTSATSTDIVIASGAQAVVGIFVGGSDTLNAVSNPLRVIQVTPGNVSPICNLNAENPSIMLLGPNTFRVVRAPTPVQVGVFMEA